MLKLHVAIIPAAALALLAACETAAPVAGPAPSEPAAPGTPAPSAPNTVLNIATTSSWVSDERLLPQDPILALVGASGRLSDAAGFSMTCTPDDGKITARLGKQTTGRAGQSARYRIRAGNDTSNVDGKFEQRGTETEFVFPITGNALRNMARADTVSIITDGGETNWAFVKDAATAPTNAKYVASLKNIGPEAEAFLVYCNPK